MGITWLCPKIWSLLLFLKTDKTENHDFTLKVFLHAQFWTQINVTHIFWHNHWRAIVRTLLLVALKFDHELIKLFLFYHKHNRVNFTLVKISSLKMGGIPFFQATNYFCTYRWHTWFKSCWWPLLGVSKKKNVNKNHKGVRIFSMPWVLFVSNIKSHHWF